MRRTARALSLAAVTGTVLGALIPAAYAGTVPLSDPSWGTASHSPCPETGGHGEWEGHTSGAEPDAALPEGTTLDELIPDDVPEEDAGIPAPAGPEAYASKSPGPTTAPPKPVEPKPSPVEPRPTGSGSTPCAPTPSSAPPAHHGVHPGGGGAFTDSVPALAAGGLLIAGAFGAAAHRLYRDRTDRADA